MNFIDPSTLSEWLAPHSIEWYKQLGKIQGKYTYSWNSTLIEPNGESIFDEEVVHTIKNKKALDVGCGHGEFTIQCSTVAKEIVGFDVTDNFIKTGKENKKGKNVSFVVGNSKHGLPFDLNEFDCAYNRKGPTSAYPDLKKVVKMGGKILGLHPGDELGIELPRLFPNLFEISQGTPILDSIKQRLAISKFSDSDIEVVNSIEYLHSPTDVLKLRCFGQKPTVYKTLKEESILSIRQIFEQNATKEGLPITFSYYIVRVTV